jgi:hypothetical protein
MGDPKAAALGFEAVKVSMSQTKDGIKIVLVIHPNDDTQDLFNNPIGSRYQMAMVLLDDEGQAVMPAKRTEGERAVASAAMLCKEPAFQQWLLREGLVLFADEECAIQHIYDHCEIDSRSDLKVNKAARDKFDELRLLFSQAR